jgi:formyltetrahydrofolate-dependent phosphoribosylglycinamide formyltransferase
MTKPRDSSKPLRLGVLLSGSGRTLLNLLKEIKDGRLHAVVAVIIASRECLGAQRARDAGLKTVVVPYKRILSIDAYSQRIGEVLYGARTDLVLQAGFLSLWYVPLRYQGCVMNIHPALLPDFGGKGMYGHRVHEAVLAAGRKESGCTVHFVTNEYDDGPIILQRRVPVLEGDTPDSLAARVFEQECIAYPEAIRLFAEARLSIEDGEVQIAPPERK